MRLAPTLITVTGVLLATVGTAQAQTPGTIKLLSKNELTELQIGGQTETFAEITPQQTAKYLIIGPVTAQVDYRLHLPDDWQEGPETFLTVYLAGAARKKYRITPKLADNDSFASLQGVRPSAPMGFYLPLGPGAHVVEFKGELGPVEGASIQVVDSAKATRKLTEAPPDPPDSNDDNLKEGDGDLKQVDGGTGTGSGNNGKSLADLKTDRDVFERRSWGLGVYAGGLVPLGEDQKVGGNYGLLVHRRLPGGLGLGLSASFSHFQESRPGDPAQGLSPTVIDFQFIPVQGHVSWHFPLRTRVDPYLIGGAGVAYGTSAFRQLQIEQDEAVVGIAASGGAGLEIDLSADFDGSAEGGQKIFVQATGSFTNVAFEAHDSDTIIGASLLAGGMIRW